MHIGSLKLTENSGLTRCLFGVKLDGSERQLHFEINRKHRNLVSNRTDSALTALLIPAMQRGTDIHVEGTISARLFYTLSGPLQSVLQIIIPSLHQVEICPEHVEPGQSGKPGVATGFSGGIDSFSVLADHYYDDPQAEFRVTHLLYNNVGSHVAGGERLFRERYRRLKPLVKRLGLPFIMVNSNLDSFYEGINFQQTHTLRNAAVGLLLQRGIGRFLYGSAYSFSEIGIEKTYDTAYSDPIILPLLSTNGIDLLSVGSEYTRVSKTLQVAGIEDSHQFLDVCVRSQSPDNCSTCWKCNRTLLTLEIAGYLDRYDDVFDLQAYSESRARYIAEVLRSNDPLEQEIVEFAKSQDYRFSLGTRLYGQTNRLTHMLRNQTSRLTRVLRNPSLVVDKLKK